MFIITRLFRRCLAFAVLLALAPCAKASAADALASPVSSTSIQIASNLQPNVARMLRMSPTFRSSYGRVASAPSVIVHVREDSRLVDGTFRARSDIRRYKSGLMIVAVFVGPGRDQAGWIAHEFEHIVEQLDGLDLRALAEHRGSGVWYSGYQMIETDRAARAGGAVLDEMKRRQGGPDKLVE